MRRAGEALHLQVHLVGVTAIPTIGEHYHDGPARHTTLSPFVVVATNSLAESSTPGPVDDFSGRGLHGLVYVMRTELASHPSESSAQRKHFYPATAHHGCMSEADEDPGVGLHRTAYVKQQN